MKNNKMNKFMNIGDVLVHSFGVVFFASCIIPASVKVMDSLQETIQQPSLTNFSFLAFKSLILLGDVILPIHFGNKLLKDAGIKDEYNEFISKVSKLKV